MTTEVTSRNNATLVNIFCSGGPREIFSYHNRDFHSDGYEFVYRPDCGDEDVLVVYAEGGWDYLRFLTRAKRRICFTGEPSVIWRYSGKFLSQFTDVVTSQRGLVVDPSVKIHNYQQSLNYFIGYDKDFHTLDVAEVEKTFANTDKPKLISAICSNKSHTEYHNRRREFLSRLKKDVPELDIYGTINGMGIRTKDEALRDYKYTIAIENCRVDDYWTEKLSDPIFSLTEPIYCGCTNIERYFDGIPTIDICDYGKSLDTVRKVIGGEYDMQKLMERRKLLLEKYSLHAVIVDVLEGRI